MVDGFQNYSSRKLFGFAVAKKWGGGNLREKKCLVGTKKKTTRTENEKAWFLLERFVWGALSMLPGKLLWFLRTNLSKKVA